MSNFREPLHYTLQFPAPHTHYVEVAVTVPTGGQPTVDLRMAVWTPGSYLVREYARHVEAVEAQGADGKPLCVNKISKNRWRVASAGTEPVRVTYRVYCREMSVRTNWVEADFALLNGAPTFLTLVEDGPRPHDVQVILPPNWSAIMTGLAARPELGEHGYRAADFDTLVDTPLLAGNPTVHTFEVGGKRHYLVNQGEAGVWDGPRSASDAEKLVRAHWHLWGGRLPYDQYLFLNLLTEAGGGLEHRNSTVLMTNRWNTRGRKSYLDWLRLVSHEYFHVWNVKRLRPVELGPFDYEREVYTKNLWIAEGVTAYYTELGVRRAGLCSDAEFLDGLSHLVQRLQTTPGRLVHSLEMASYDAWIKLYRSDENSSNTTISYYTKGAVVAFLLDAKIRAATDGSKSLDDVLRLAYGRYAGERGFTREEFRAVAEETAGMPLQGWFVRALETTEELDYTEALDWFGLRFSSVEAVSKGGWTGLETRVAGGCLLISQVRRNTPGWHAGFNVDDEILAIDDDRVLPDHWKARLRQYQPGDRVSVLIARRARLRRLDVTLEAEPPTAWKLEPRPDASEAQTARRAVWLAGPAEPPPA
jgi:predicted metalloprotease with PDZ domain